MVLIAAGGALVALETRPQMKEAGIRGSIAEKTVVSQLSTAGDPTAGWKVYRNEEYGFTFKYPKQWRAEFNRGDDPFLILYSLDQMPNETPDTIRFSLTQFATDKYYWQDDATTYSEDSWRDSLQKTIFQGLPALKIIFNNPSDFGSVFRVRLNDAMVLNIDFNDASAQRSQDDKYYPVKSKYLRIYEDVIKSLRLR